MAERKEAGGRVESVSAGAGIEAVLSSTLGRLEAVVSAAGSEDPDARWKAYRLLAEFQRKISELFVQAEAAFGERERELASSLPAVEAEGSEVVELGDDAVVEAEGAEVSEPPELPVEAVEVVESEGNVESERLQFIHEFVSKAFEKGSSVISVAHDQVVEMEKLGLLADSSERGFCDENISGGNCDGEPVVIRLIFKYAKMNRDEREYRLKIYGGNEVKGYSLEVAGSN
ncbi:MAG: hypothetical protein ABIH78_00590 [Candidatus Peregrinibacteria bacterium]